MKKYNIFVDGELAAKVEILSPELQKVEIEDDALWALLNNPTNEVLEEEDNWVLLQNDENLGFEVETVLAC